MRENRVDLFNVFGIICLLCICIEFEMVTSIPEKANYVKFINYAKYLDSGEEMTEKGG